MDVRTYDDFGFGFSWVTDETLTRTSHALADEDRVWLVDPVDAGDALERATALGTPTAVLQLLDRHNRDCGAVAQRLGVPRLVVPDAVPGSPFEVIRTLRIPRWRESALWWPARRTLVVAEAIGTNVAFTGGRAGAGMHLLLRPLPPGSLRGYEPEHLLVGHGPGLHGPAAAGAVDAAYARSRRDLPRVLAALPGAMRA
jgi:hypothetical protein